MKYCYYDGDIDSFQMSKVVIKDTESKDIVPFDSNLIDNLLTFKCYLVIVLDDALFADRNEMLKRSLAGTSSIKKDIKDLFVLLDKDNLATGEIYLDIVFLNFLIKLHSHNGKLGLSIESSQRGVEVLRTWLTDDKYTKRLLLSSADYDLSLGKWVFDLELQSSGFREFFDDRYIGILDFLKGDFEPHMC